MIDVVNLIYDTYISFFPTFLASDVLVLFIGKIIVLITVLSAFYFIFFYPLIFVVKLSKKIFSIFK